MRKAVTLEADEKLKRSVTKGRCDRLYGRANKENEEELKKLFLSLPPTTSSTTKQQVSGMAEKAVTPDSVSEKLGLRGKSSK